jgi:glycosyltransferase involved in cell wall biosynthesis
MKKLLLLYFLLIFGSIHAESNLPDIMLLLTGSHFWGGVATHSLCLYNTLSAHGYNTIIVVSKSSKIPDELLKRNIPFITSEALLPTLKDLCSKTSIKPILFCNSVTDARLGYEASLQHPLKRILIQLNFVIPVKHYLRKNDGLIGVSPEITEQLQQENFRHKLGVNLIKYIPPFFDEEKFMQFTTQESHEDFFHKNFKVTINKTPILSMVAHFYNDLKHKNHPLFFEAIHKLIYEKNKKFQVMLAGTGPQQGYLKKLAHELKINDYVHFLGFTNEIPALLYHSDIHVLSSSLEAFGIAHLEAGIMKKPTVGATETGATAMIQDGITGLIFNNNNADDLAEKLEILLDNKSLRETMGAHAHAHIQKEFAREALFQKLKIFLQ